MSRLVSLKQAQKDPKAMEQFIAEHEGDEIEDKDFDKVIGSMAKNKGAVPKNDS